jgi:hypothetical protein
VSRRQLLALGLSSAAIGARVKTGALAVRYPGVYALAPAREDPVALAAAAVLACGSHAVLSHASAAYLWGFLRYWEPPPHVALRRRPGRGRPRRPRSRPSTSSTHWIPIRPDCSSSAVLVAATTVATVTRYVALRSWVFARPAQRSGCAARPRALKRHLLPRPRALKRHLLPALAR